MDPEKTNLKLYQCFSTSVSVTRYAVRIPGRSFDTPPVLLYLHHSSSGCRFRGGRLHVQNVGAWHRPGPGRPLTRILLAGPRGETRRCRGSNAPDSGSLQPAEAPRGHCPCRRHRRCGLGIWPKPLKGTSQTGKKEHISSV